MKALEPARPRAALARRHVPLDTPLLRGPALCCREGPRGAAPGVNVAETLFDRGADLAGLGIEDLVSEHEAVALDADHPAHDVQVVAGAELADVAHVATGGHTEALAASRVRQAEAQRVQHATCGVGEMGEIERNGQVAVVVLLPAVNDPAIRLEPAVHGVFLLDSTEHRARDPSKPTRVGPARARVLSW